VTPQPEPTPDYAHRATYVPAVGRQRDDGDTFRLRLDLGTYVRVRLDPVVPIRLHGIDTWELGGVVHPLDPDRAKGRAAAAATAALLGKAGRITAQTLNLTDTLGRQVARVWVDGHDLADLLRVGGHEKQPAPAVRPDA
jgi:endonuclease YncB( thermonuclease family)